jgi:hypothetical protein
MASTENTKAKRFIDSFLFTACAPLDIESGGSMGTLVLKQELNCPERVSSTYLDAPARYLFQQISCFLKWDVSACRRDLSGGSMGWTDVFAFIADNASLRNAPALIAV